jgi:hypothetical protein
MAVPWRSAIRSAHRAHVSSCTCCTCLRERQAKRGIASICIGGGQGGAMLVESDQLMAVTGKHEDK